MNPLRETIWENSDFRLRFFQSSLADSLPSASAVTCSSTQPALKLAEKNTRSFSSTTGCAHLGHLLFAHAYFHRAVPSLGSYPATLAALIDRTCRLPPSVTRVGELKLASSSPARQAGVPSSQRNASTVEPLVMPPVTITRSSTTSGEEHLPK